MSHLDAGAGSQHNINQSETYDELTSYPWQGHRWQLNLDGDSPNSD